MKRRSVTGAFCVLAILAAADPAPAHGAESAGADAWKADLSGEVRLRGEYRDDNDLDRGEDDDRREGLQRVRLGVKLTRGEEVSVFVQAQDSRVAGEEEGTVSDEKNLDLHQGYVEVRAFGRSGLVLYAGRREWAYGDQRLIGNFGWDNVGRAFDGATLHWQRRGVWVDGFYGRLDHEVVNAAGGTRGDSLAGAYAQWSPRKGDEWEGYAILFHDSAEAAGEGGSGTTRVEMLGARARSQVRRLEYRLEAAVQRGRFNGDDHRAGAAAAQLGLDLGSRKRWRAIAGYDFAAGDADAADGEHGEFFNFFPTNHPHYGAMDLFGWRNLRSPWMGASFASARHGAQVRIHLFALDEAGGRWSSAGGATLGFDAAGGSGRRVGREADVTYRFGWSERIALEAGASRFEPGRFAEATRGPDPSHFGYLMLSVSF